MPNTIHYIIGDSEQSGPPSRIYFQSTKLTAAIISLSFVIADQEGS